MEFAKGIRSRRVLFNERLNEIVDAIVRYRKAEMAIPTDWITEYNTIIECIRNNHKKDTMSEFKVRLKKEIIELDSKHSGLKSFLESDKVNDIDPIQKILLVEQFHFMSGYLNASKKRLALLNGGKLEGDQTTGMKRVVLDFNPSDSPVVHLIKTISASLIDLGEELRGNENDGRCISIAQTEIETACMFMVKSNFV